MLVRMTSSTSGEMIMFAEHAHALWEWMGKECTARGVFTTAQLPEAIARLHRGVEEEKLAARLQAEEKCAAGEVDSEGEDDAPAEKPDEEPVSLIQRAQPLINLMRWTLKEEGFITWEAAKDF